ncbi:hypothetical protein NQ317_004193 [Molorchus minor]|uniref:Uncharacterized protein n=1 Tax=Molorchus minor TaxID=1323400 RepID=A0ABQ9JDP9_9CUCU|nr:hypothetical protein NQ317_004193 [Molorchus minor]
MDLRNVNYEGNGISNARYNRRKIEHPYDLNQSMAPINQLLIFLRFCATVLIYHVLAILVVSIFQQYPVEKMLRYSETGKAKRGKCNWFSYFQ